MKFRNIIIITLSLFLGACASTTQLTKESSDSVKTIAFSEKVTIPEKAYYYGPEQGAGAVFGVIGAIIADAATTKDELIVEYMKKNNIDIASIAMNEFKNQVKLNPRFAAKQNIEESKNPDAKFVVDVRIYGLSQTHGFSSVYRPMVGIAAKLVSANGEVMWEEYEYITAMNDGVEAVEFEEYFKDPAVLSGHFEKVTKNVVALLMQSL